MSSDRPRTMPIRYCTWPIHGWCWSAISLDFRGLWIYWRTFISLVSSFPLTRDSFYQRRKRSVSGYPYWYVTIYRRTDYVYVVSDNPGLWVWKKKIKSHWYRHIDRKRSIQVVPFSEGPGSGRRNRPFHSSHHAGIHGWWLHRKEWRNEEREEKEKGEGPVPSLFVSIRRCLSVSKKDFCCLTFSSLALWTNIFCPAPFCLTLNPPIVFDHHCSGRVMTNENPIVSRSVAFGSLTLFNSFLFRIFFDCSLHAIIWGMSDRNIR